MAIDILQRYYTAELLWMKFIGAPSSHPSVEGQTDPFILTISVNSPALRRFSDLPHVGRPRTSRFARYPVIGSSPIGKTFPRRLNVCKRSEGNVKLCSGRRSATPLRTESPAPGSSGVQGRTIHSGQWFEDFCGYSGIGGRCRFRTVRPRSLLMPHLSSDR
jgi:hypothetical protein